MPPPHYAIRRWAFFAEGAGPGPVNRQ